MILLSRRHFATAVRSIIGDTRLRSLLDWLRGYALLVSAVSSAAAQGLRKAEQYRMLAHGSDVQRRLPRAELLRAIMFMKH
jgi:hypothetical protein